MEEKGGKQKQQVAFQDQLRRWQRLDPIAPKF